MSKHYLSYCINNFPFAEVNLFLGGGDNPSEKHNAYRSSLSDPHARFARISIQIPEPRNTVLFFGTEHLSSFINGLEEILRISEGEWEKVAPHSLVRYQAEGWQISLSSRHVRVNMPLTDKSCDILITNLDSTRLFDSKYRQKSVDHMRSRIKDLIIKLIIIRDAAIGWETEGKHLDIEEKSSIINLPQTQYRKLHSSVYRDFSLVFHADEYHKKLKARGQQKFVMACPNQCFITFNSHDQISRPLIEIWSGIADGLMELSKDLSFPHRVDILKDDPFNGYVALVPTPHKPRIVISYDKSAASSGKIVWPVDAFDLQDIIDVFKEMVVNFNK